MEELIKKYKKQIDWLNERLDTAIYIGDHQKIRISTEIMILYKVIDDLKALLK